MATRLALRRQSEMRRNVARRQAIARRASVAAQNSLTSSTGTPKPIFSRRISRYDVGSGGIHCLLTAIPSEDLDVIEAVLADIKDTVTLLNKDMFHVALTAIHTENVLIVARIMREVKGRRYFPMKYLVTLLIEAIRTKRVEIIKHVKVIRPKLMIPETDVVQIVFEAINTMDPRIVKEIVKCRQFKKKVSNENAFQILTKALSSENANIISSIVTYFKPKTHLSPEHKLTILRVAISIHHLQTVEFCFKLKSFLTPEDGKEILMTAAESTAAIFDYVHDAIHPMLCKVPVNELLVTAMRVRNADVVDQIVLRYKFLDISLLEILLKHLREPDPNERILICILKQIYFIPENMAAEILSVIISRDFLQALTCFHWNKHRSELSNIVSSALVSVVEDVDKSDTEKTDIGRDDIKASRDHSRIIQSIIQRCRTLDNMFITDVLQKLSTRRNIKCLELFLHSISSNWSENDKRDIIHFMSTSVHSVDVEETLMRCGMRISLDDIDRSIRRCSNEKVKQILISHRRRIVSEQFRKQYGDALQQVYFGYNSKQEIVIVAIFDEEPDSLLNEFMSYNVLNKISPSVKETEL